MFPSLSAKRQRVLLLESTHEAEHMPGTITQGSDASDPACSATARWIHRHANRFYGGTLTQDRLGYESSKIEAGQEFDCRMDATTREEIKGFWIRIGGEQNCFVSPAGRQHDPVVLTAWVVQQIKRAALCG